jgi:L-alanine-DL-glutamate epimerase-like enolase superfamily enzyme
MIKLENSDIKYEIEPLEAPFGFKGKYVEELWQIAVRMESNSGYKGLGLGVQSVLWSDSQVFSRYGNLEGNKLMFSITEHALKLASNLNFETPMELLDKLLPSLYEYGCKITGLENLRKTFILNALVAVDNAAWMLFCAQKGINSFDKLIPDQYKGPFVQKNEMLAGVPIIAYGTTKDEILRLIKQGCFFFKIKIGCDPENDGDQDKMLEWDKKRLQEIHVLLKDIFVPYTKGGWVPYYLDANGRYESKERLMKLLDFADTIGALDRIILLEEPFSENYVEDVHDIPVRLAADESVHSDNDVTDRIEQGYKAIALKPIAKTLSMCFKMAQRAFEKGIPCFCADLTVNPVMVDWNKNVAARLSPLPNMNIGILECNGAQNYKNWEKMKSYHPYATSEWTETTGGVFKLNDDFYGKSGGIFVPSEHYLSKLEIFDKEK